jgi:hypothetical protein
MFRLAGRGRVSAFLQTLDEQSGRLAQLEERSVYTRKVTSSSLVPPTDSNSTR